MVSGLPLSRSFDQPLPLIRPASIWERNTTIGCDRNRVPSRLQVVGVVRVAEVDRWTASHRRTTSTDDEDAEHPSDASTGHRCSRSGPDAGISTVMAWCGPRQGFRESQRPQSTTDTAARAISIASTMAVPPNRNQPILKATDPARAITAESYRAGWAHEYRPA